MSSPALVRQLLAYTLAGSAGMLAAGSADAALVYSGLLNQSVTVGNAYAIDFNGGGTDLTFQLRQDGAFNAESISSAGCAVAKGTLHNWVANFASGAPIVGTFDGSAVLQLYSSGGSYLAGHFPANATGFLGFALGTEFVGWVRLSFGGPVNATTGFTVVDWAYTTSGAGILAGQTTSAVPGAGALAALAVGASGLRGRRRRERAA